MQNPNQHMIPEKEIPSLLVPGPFLVENGQKRYFGKELQNIPTMISENANPASKNEDNVVPSKNLLLKKTRQLSLDQNVLSKISIELPKKFSSSPNFTIKINFTNPNPELEYIDEIYQNLLMEDNSNDRERNFDYMKYQTDLTPKIRAMLVNYVVEVAEKFNLKNKTLYLSVQIIDRLFSREKINKHFFQLVGITSLFISSKYEEIYYPDIKDWVEITGGKYTEDQILKMEDLIVGSLDFHLLPIYPYAFYEIICLKLGIEKEDFFLGALILEIALFDYALVKYKSSTICESVIIMLMKIVKRKKEKRGLETIDLDNWLKMGFGNFIDTNPKHVKKITECNSIICTLMDNIENCLFRKVVEKYSRKEYCCVTNFAKVTQ